MLRVAELERRLGMDSSNSGMLTSKEPIGARQRRNAERRNRQASERERRKDRTRGGQPGNPGTGLARDPGPGERKSADPPAQCSRCGTALDGTQSAGSSWAQVWDVQISRLVTEWLLPMRECPCRGQVTHGRRAAPGCTRAPSPTGLRSTRPRCQILAGADHTARPAGMAAKTGPEYCGLPAVRTAAGRAWTCDRGTNHAPFGLEKMRVRDGQPGADGTPDSAAVSRPFASV